MSNLQVQAAIQLNRILDIADRIVYMEDGRLADNSNTAAMVEYLMRREQNRNGDKPPQ